MLSGLFRLLPLFQLLFEIFKPGEGEQVTRGAKISALAITALLLYSGFVSYAYVEQYHVAVGVSSKNNYLETTLAEKKGELSTLREERKEFRDKYFTCLEDGSYKQTERPDMASTPVMPVHTEPNVTVVKPSEHRQVGVRDGSVFRQELLDELNKE